MGSKSSAGVDELREWHKTWVSSGSSSKTDDTREGDAICGDCTGEDSESSEMSDFLKNLAVHDKLLQLQRAGGDVYELIPSLFPGDQIYKIIPRGEQGELLSIGSLRHNVLPCGTQCK